MWCASPTFGTVTLMFSIAPMVDASRWRRCSHSCVSAPGRRSCTGPCLLRGSRRPEPVVRHRFEIRKEERTIYIVTHQLGTFGCRRIYALFPTVKAHLASSKGLCRFRIEIRLLPAGYKIFRTKFDSASRVREGILELALTKCAPCGSTRNPNSA